LHKTELHENSIRSADASPDSKGLTMKAAENSMKITANHHEWHERYDACRKYLPRLLKARTHHCEKRSRHTWNVEDSI